MHYQGRAAEPSPGPEAHLRPRARRAPGAAPRRQPGPSGRTAARCGHWRRRWPHGETPRARGPCWNGHREAGLWAPADPGAVRGEGPDVAGGAGATVAERQSADPSRAACRQAGSGGRRAEGYRQGEPRRDVQPEDPGARLPGWRRYWEAGLHAQECEGAVQRQSLPGSRGSLWRAFGHCHCSAQPASGCGSHHLAASGGHPLCANRASRARAVTRAGHMMVYKARATSAASLYLHGAIAFA
mmetsp:Transcript_116148/g.375293  ORF Transcript_116148/g.375293 Transcript_116148/m.375293 type:complete len:242 (-) Transcript_116148:31-756(-)